MSDFDLEMQRALMADHAKLVTLMGDDAPDAPQFFVTCDCCDGSGDSGETEVLQAPATWDDPGFYEVNPLPCQRCGGTGMMEVTP